MGAVKLYEIHEMTVSGQDLSYIRAELVRDESEVSTRSERGFQGRSGTAGPGHTWFEASRELLEDFEWGRAAMKAWDEGDHRVFERASAAPPPLHLV